MLRLVTFTSVTCICNARWVPFYQALKEPPCMKPTCSILFADTSETAVTLAKSKTFEFKFIFKVVVNRKICH